MSFQVDVSLAVWSGSKRGRVLSETRNIVTSRQDNYGKVGNRGIEDGGSSHLQGSRREGNAGRRFEADGVPRAYATTMEYQV